jgi:hypothetical protein
MAAIFPLGTKYPKKKLLLLANDYLYEYTVFLIMLLWLIKSLKMT